MTRRSRAFHLVLMESSREEPIGGPASLRGWVPFLGGKEAATDLSRRVLPDTRMFQYWDDGAVTRHVRRMARSMPIVGGCLLLVSGGYVVYYWLSAGPNPDRVAGEAAAQCSV